MKTVKLCGEPTSEMQEAGMVSLFVDSCKLDRQEDSQTDKKCESEWWELPSVGNVVALWMQMCVLPEQ